MIVRRGIMAAFTGIALSGCALYIDDGDDGPGDPPGDDTPDDPPEMAPLTTSDPGITEMELDGTHLYWIDNGQMDGEANLRRMPRGGGAVETLYSGPASVLGMALDAESAYIVHTWGGGGSYAGSVVRIAKADGAVTTLTDGFNPLSIAVDDGWVYYNEGTGIDGRIWRIGSSGGTPELVVEGVANPYDLAVAEGVVYYTEMNAGRTMRVGATGGIATMLASGWTGTNYIALDGESVYFSACPTGECAPGYLYRVGRNGGDVEQILNAGQPSSNGKIAISEGAILWGDRFLPVEGGQIDVMPIESTSENNVFVEAVAADAGDFYFAEFYSGDIYMLD